MLLVLLSDWIRTDKRGCFFPDVEQKAVPGKVQCRHKGRACSCECKFQDVFPGFAVRKWLKGESQSIQVALLWNLCRVKWKWVCEEEAPRFSFLIELVKAFSTFWTYLSRKDEAKRAWDSIQKFFQSINNNESLFKSLNVFVWTSLKCKW